MAHGESDGTEETTKIDDAAVAGRLAGLDTGLVSDALDRLGLDGVAAGSWLALGGRRLVGPAVTVRLVPAGAGSASSTGSHLAAGALDAARPGQAMVVATEGRVSAGAWGGLLTRAGRVRDVAGVVVDGAVRDADEIEELGVPVFARGATPRSARGRWVEAEWGEAVEVGGVRVEPSDWVVGDGTGVVVVPRGRMAEVLETAEALASVEAAMAKRLDARQDVTTVLGAEYEGLTDVAG